MPNGEQRSGRDRLEQWSAVLLAAATVATAYSAYEATRWGGEQATRFTQAGATRTDSAKALAKGANLQNFDNAVHLQVVAAQAAELYHYVKPISQQARAEFEPTLNEWIKRPGYRFSPFDLPSYTVSELDRAEVLDAEADALFDQGRDANQNSDNYVLSTIFFAMVLFFAGIATKFQRDQVVLWMLGFGALVFSVGLIRLLTLPFH